MLGKLMKHEWKGTYKFGGIMVLTIFVLTLIGYLFLRYSAIGEVMQGETVLKPAEIMTLTISSIGTLILYYLALIGAMYGAIIYLAVRFYKTMYTNQGYLTHTLPVTPGQLLTSKILVSGVWTLFVYLAVFASIFILLFGLFQGLLGADAMEGTLEEAFREIAAIYRDMGFDFATFGIVMIFMGVLSPFISMIQIFGALTIGQLSKKHKLMVGIFTYIGFIVLNYIVTMVMETVVMINSMFSAVGEISLGFMNTTYIASIVYSVLTAVVLVLVSHRIVKKKLNMN